MVKKNAIQTMLFDTEYWLTNSAIKALAPELKGVWIDMMCYMWVSCERGVMLKPNGEIYSKGEIARLLSINCKLIDRLVECGVCSLRNDGAYYCRAMVRNEAIRIKRQTAGKKGGNMTKAKVFTTTPPVVLVIPERPEETKPIGQQAELFPPEDIGSPPPLTPEQQKKAEKVKKYKYADSVTLTRDEYAKLCAEYSEEAAKEMIVILDNYKGSKGKKYKSDYKAILTWVVDKYNEKIMKYGIKRPANDGRCGVTNNQAVSGPEVQANSGNGDGRDSEAQKDYSQRF
jgi:hypothetical protein